MFRPPTLALAPTRHLVDVGRRVTAWPVSSQQGSRRNAMLAATEIRHRRREQLEVEAFLASVGPRRAAATG